jgi:hypothetical protein
MALPGLLSAHLAAHGRDGDPAAMHCATCRIKIGERDGLTL